MHNFWDAFTFRRYSAPFCLRAEWAYTDAVSYTHLDVYKRQMYGVGVYSSLPVEVTVGGATIFVLNVERFEKI